MIIDQLRRWRRRREFVRRVRERADETREMMLQIARGSPDKLEELLGTTPTRATELYMTAVYLVWRR